jgi:hypothetical protein
MRRFYVLPWVVTSLVGCNFPTKDFRLASADVAPKDDRVEIPDQVEMPDIIAPIDVLADVPMTLDADVMDVADVTDVRDVVIESSADVRPDGMADVVAPCPEGQIRCGGDGGVSTCQSPLSNALNCGICGRTCAAGQFCFFGGCQRENSLAYARSNPPAAMVPFVDACTTVGSSVLFTSTDDASAVVALPINFSLFGTAFPAGSMIALSTNGYLSLLNMPATLPIGDIPSTVLPNAVIAPFWTDLEGVPGSVCIATLGSTVGERRFVVEWNNTTWFNAPPGTPRMTFEVILNEGANSIDFVYQSSPANRQSHADGGH